MMKLWHDDVRPAPEGWVWARTNAEAQRLLMRGTVTECSLDHDLGFHHVEATDRADLLLRGSSPDGTGLDLVRWMIRHQHVPAKVTIHSWNPSGASQMAAELRHHGFECVLRPYTMDAPLSVKASVRQLSDGRWEWHGSTDRTWARHAQPTRVLAEAAVRDYIRGEGFTPPEIEVLPRRGGRAA